MCNLNYMHKVNINCDIAESYGNLKIGQDKKVLSYVDAVNIACGFHGGDPLTIVSTVKHAVKQNKYIGAHPSYPDLSGFGRRYMEMSDEELSACLRYQICAVKSITESFGGKLFHVKVHGALYNIAAKNKREAEIITTTIYSIDPNLKIFAPFGSEMADSATNIGLHVIYETFADRRYDSTGQLTNRNAQGSVITDPNLVLLQVSNILNGYVETTEGNQLPIISDTICVHGDHTAVIESLKLIRQNYESKSLL